MFCPHCGKENEEKNKFCIDCGKELVILIEHTKKTNKKFILVFIITFLVLSIGIFCWFLSYKSVKTPAKLAQQPVQRQEILDYTKGTEVENGLYLVLKVDCSRFSSGACRDAVKRTAQIIANRLPPFYFDEKIPFGVYLSGNDGIIIQLPPTFKQESLLELISRTGYIEFKIVSDDAEKLRQALGGGIPQGYELKYLNGQPLLLEDETSLTGSSFKNVFVQTENQFNQPTVVLEFDSKGTQVFANVTAANIGKRLAIVLDGKIISSPVIRETITSGQLQISDLSFEKAEANNLAVILRSGALPMLVMIREVRTISGPIGFNLRNFQLTHVRFPFPLTMEDLKDSLESQEIPTYIQMLEKGMEYLIWLKTDLGHAEEIIRELVESNSGQIMGRQTVNERVEPDITSSIDSIDYLK